MTRLTLLLATLALAACSGGGDTRYPIQSMPSQGTPSVTRLYVSSIELRDVIIPAYAEDSQMLYRGPDGGLAPLTGGEWAAPTSAAITAELARGLDMGGSATVVAEPWPLSDSAQVRLNVRIDRMIASPAGFELGGQFAVSSPDMVVREFVERFDVTVPLAELPPTPGQMAAAYGAALGQLRDRILTRLSR